MIQLALRGGRTTYRPGEVLEGTASWSSSSPVERLVFLLAWTTHGVADHDSRVVERIVHEAPGASGEKEFRLVLPKAPFSFTGRYVGLTWVVGAGLEPEIETARIEVDISPTGSRILLQEVQPESSG